jgi:hypothetical protein
VREAPITSAPIKHRSFGPRAIEVAHFLAPRIGREPPFDLMEQIDRWPGLSFRDFVGVVLAGSLALRPESDA